MQLGMIGLGRMGANLVRRLMRAGHECVAYDVNAAAVQVLESEGAVGAATLVDVATLGAFVLTTPQRAGCQGCCSEIPLGGDLAGLDRDVVAERFELADEASGEAVGVLAGEVVAAEVAV